MLPQMIQIQDLLKLKPPECDCLERLRLKVEQELDKLRGEFRKKEVDLIAPLLNKYTMIDKKIDIIHD